LIRLGFLSFDVSDTAARADTGQRGGSGEASVGSTGDSYDNALAETINGLYKAEIIHRRGPWKTREAVCMGTVR
jgi:hypothetical protein